ncbi:MAG: DUF1080 domain-containing protein [Acidobacteriota bacterium]|nr:MAG: DUF1080 domain-containing protein [Acidobacteriota bacterium]
MRVSKSLLLLLAAILLMMVSCAEAPAPVEEVEEVPAAAPASIELFNGTDLTGWDSFLVEPEVKTEDVWSVQDGILICKGEPLGYLYTTEKYTSFNLVVEWRWAPGTEPGNSGVLMRINGEPMGIPRSIEAQLQSGNAGDVYGFHGMKLTGPEERMRGQEGHELLGDFVGVGKVEPNENTPGEWNRYEITLDGGDLTTLVNGKQVNHATQVDVVEGNIGLQSEGGEIHFRKITLTPIAGN